MSLSNALRDLGKQQINHELLFSSALSHVALNQPPRTSHRGGGGGGAAATAAAAANQANGAAGAKTPPWSEKFAFAFYSNGKRRRIRRDNEIGKARAGKLQQLVELFDDHTLEETDCINLEAFISIGAQLRLRLSEQQGELPATFEADAAKYFDEACNEPHGE